MHLYILCPNLSLPLSLFSSHLKSFHLFLKSIISKSLPTTGSTNGVECFRFRSTESERIESIHAHCLHVAVAGEVEADYHDQVSEDEDGALKVIALSFSVDIGEEEDAKYHGDYVPLRENEAEVMVRLFHGFMWRIESTYLNE